MIPDGPDDTLDALLHVIMGVLSTARHRVWIMTPYFLPDRQMFGCLQAARSLPARLRDGVAALFSPYL